MKKRVLSALLALVIALSLMPPVEVAAAEIVASGECGAEGSNVTWTLDSAGTLTISGTGVIKNNVFTGFESKDDRIQSVVIKDGITAISHSTFSGCANLASVTFPPSLTTIGNMAFQDCTSLTNISLPDTITTIGQSAFGRSGLRSIVLPKGITTISQYLLRGSKQLTSVVIPNSVNRIEYRAFAECGSLESITLPESITILESGVFTDCTDLRNLFLPRALTEIGAWCFTGTAIERMDIPENVTTLGSTCFSDCPELTEVCIYGGITDISDYTFARCPKLTKLVLPKSIKKISRYALERSSSIKDIYYSGTKEEWALVEKGDRYECPELYNATIYFDTEPIPTSSPTPTPTPTPSPSPKPSASPSAKPTVPADAEASGECGADGDNVVWWVKDDTLTISGEGDMKDFSFSEKAIPPWIGFANNIKLIKVTDGVTGIGTEAFYQLIQCDEVFLGKDICSVRRGSLCAGSDMHLISVIFESDPPENLDEAAFPGRVTVYYKTGTEAHESDWINTAMKPFYTFDLSKTDKIDRQTRVYPRWVYFKSAIASPTKSVWSFRNDDQCWPGKEAGYYITQSDYDRLTEFLTWSEKNAITKSDIHVNADTDWSAKLKNFNVDGKVGWAYHIPHGGSCYGMSACAAAVMNGSLNAARLPGSSGTLYSIEEDRPGNEKISQQTQSIANFYHMQQNLKKVQDKSREVMQCKRQFDQLKMMDDMVRDAQENGRTVLIGFDMCHYTKDSEGRVSYHTNGHTIVGYGIEDGIFPMYLNGKYYIFYHRVRVYDPVNDGHAQKESDYSLYYNDTQWAIPGYDTVEDDLIRTLSTEKGISLGPFTPTRTDNCAQLTGLLADPNYINAVDYLTGAHNYNLSREAAPTIPGYIRTASQNLTLTIDGRKVVIKDGLFDGETTISDTGAMIFFPCAGEGSDSYSILLPEGAQYSVTAEEEFSCSLETDDYYLSAASSGAGTASFTAEGAAALDLDGSGPAYLSLTANDSPVWHSFEVASDNTGYLDLELTDGGFKLEGDGLDGSEFAAYDDEEDAEPQRFSTKEDSLLVTDKDGKAAVFADRDDDGEYETPVDTAPVQEEPMPFTDVKEGAFYYDAVRWAAAKGIVKGTGGTTFSPEGTCTRSQVATFLWRAAGQPKPVSSKSTFTDITPGAFYYDAVLWAQEQGIVQGTGGTSFSPEGPCTRSQVATFLWRAAKKPNPASSKSTFTDITPGAFYYEAVLWAQEQGIVQGTGGTSFSPEGPCTRSQVATFLYRAS